MHFPRLARIAAARHTGIAVISAMLALTSGTAAQAGTHEEAERDFKAQCASCHGWSGAGDGPVADVLKVRPPDLTLISKRNGGTFPAEAVYKSIEGFEMPRAHGTKQMPVWGIWFSYEAIADSLHTGDKTPPPEKIDKRIRALVAYIQSIQK